MLFRNCFQHLYQVHRQRIVMPPNVTMRLNRGERPQSLPIDFMELLSQTSKRFNVIQQYPSYSEFYERLARYFGTAPSEIVVGAGIEEFIRTLTFLCCDPGEKAAVLWPTCAMYDIYARAFGVELCRIKPRPGKAFTVHELLGALEYHNCGDKALRVFFLPNPGQPVETCFDVSQLRMIASWCHDRDIVFAVDEAHYGFGAPTALSMALGSDFDNTIVLRTFSKFFSAASIRVGCAIGQERVIKPLNAVRPSGEVSDLSMQLATLLMDNVHILTTSAYRTTLARNWLRNTINDELGSRGIRAHGTYGFSILIEFDFPEQAAIMGQRLANCGILVKSNFPAPVDRCMLLSCGDLSLMKAFYTRFRDCLERFENG